MSGLINGLRAAAMAVAMALGSVVAAHAAPLSAYGRLPMIEDAQISPDATMVAYALTDGENRLIVIKRVSDGKVMGGLKAGDIKIRDIRWAGSEYLIVTTSQTASVMDLLGPRREYFMAQSYEIATGKQRGLMERAENAMNTIYSVPYVGMMDGEMTAVVEGVTFVENRGQVALFRVKLKNGATRLMEPGVRETSDWAVGADGLAVAQTEYEQKTGEWRLRFKSNGRWVVADSLVAPLGQPWLAGPGRDGRSALVVYYDDDGGQVMKEYPASGGEPAVVTTKSFDFLIRDPATSGLIGLGDLVGDDLRYNFFAPQDQATWKGVVKAFAGDRVSLTSWSDDRRKIVVRVDSPIQGPAYSLIDLDQKSAVWIGDIYDGLKPADISEVRPVTYKARDGLTITGYLTLPRGKDPKNLPLIVLPHGGPAARDELVFDWWAQALASRGYAVLQPNFRGSDGFGRDFLEAGYGEWGKKMQTDLSDGVRDLAGKGLIDPRRVCIVGASYGGYAAMAGPTLDPGVYRCAVAVAGISDLKRFMDAQVNRIGLSQNQSLRYWSRFLGVDGRRDPDLAAISPATFAAKADAPMLLIHGKDDTVVLYNQSQIMYDALRKAGKPAELVTLKGEDHWLSRGETRLQMLTSIVAFLEKHNPPT